MKDDFLKLDLNRCAWTSLKQLLDGIAIKYLDTWIFVLFCVSH